MPVKQTQDIDPAHHERRYGDWVFPDHGVFYSKIVAKEPEQDHQRQEKAIQRR